MSTTTITIEMTGRPIAVAGEGECTITGTSLLKWFFVAEGDDNPTPPDEFHRTNAFRNTSMKIPSLTNLWVLARNGTKCTVSRKKKPGLTQSAPENTAAPVVSGSVSIGSVLSVTNGSWSANPAITGYTYQWLRNGIIITGATNSVYTLVSADSNTTVSCRVTATNPIGSQSQDSNGLLIQNASAPVITGVPTISGTLTVGQTLTATAAPVSGAPTPTRGWQWRRNGVNITLAGNNSTYVLVAADAGQTITVRQTETNSAGSANATSVATSAIQSPPAITGVPTITGSAVVGQVLTANPAAASGSPTPTRTWRWRANGVDIAGATNATYSIVNGDIGKTITVRQTETNTIGSANATSAATAAVQAAAPGAAAPILTNFSINWTTGAATVDANVPCRLYARRDPPATNPSGADIISGTGAAETKFWDLVSGSNNLAWAFAATLDANFQLSFAARVEPNGDISNVVTSSGEIDTTPDTISSSVPTDGGTNFPIANNLVVTMGDLVKTTTGTAVLRIQGGATIETFTLSTGSGSGGGTVAINNNILTFNPAANLATSTTYELELIGVQDEAGNAFTGDLIISFTTDASGPAGFSFDFTNTGTYPTVAELGTLADWTANTSITNGMSAANIDVDAANGGARLRSGETRAGYVIGAAGAQIANGVWTMNVNPITLTYSNNIYIYFRWVDANNWAALRMVDGDYAAIVTNTGGAGEVVVVESFSPSEKWGAQAPFEIKIEFSGSNVTIKQDNVAFWTNQVVTAHQTATGKAIRIDAPGGGQSWRIIDGSII